MVLPQPVKHFFRRISGVRLQYAKRLVLYSFFIPLFSFWLLSQLFGEWIWLFDLINQFQIQFSFAFLLFAVVFHLAHRPTGLHLSTLAFLYIMLQLYPLYIKENARLCIPPECQKESLQIVQYNLFYENRNLGGVLKWAKDIALTTDLLVLHEIPSKWQLPLRRLNKYYPYYFITTDAAPYDMAVFSKIPLNQRESWGDDAERNVAIRVHGVTQKRAIPFQLYAIHVASPLSMKAWKRRNRALRFHGWQLRDFAQPNQILLGDFNTTIFSAWYRRIERVSGLRNAQYGFGIMPTWSFFEKTTMFNGLQIDHMLVSPEIDIEDRHTLGDYGSDHLPTYTKLWLYK